MRNWLMFPTTATRSPWHAQLWAVLLCLALAVLVGSTLLVVHPAIPGRLSPEDAFAWDLGADVAAPQFNNVDIEPGIMRVGADRWMLYSDGANVWHRFRGPDSDHMTELTPGRRDSSFTQPNGDDRYWIAGLWSEGQTWFATVHIEYHYRATAAPTFNWFRRIGLATSTDQGMTWHYSGDIVTSAYPTTPDAFPGDYYNWGVGDQKFFVDERTGFAYVYYMTAWVQKITGARYQAVRVARAPLSGGLGPGTWRKWYEHAWNESALGGHESDIFAAQDSATVFYSTALKRYVAIGAAPSVIATATDLSIQNWSPRQRFTEDARQQFYNWPVDAKTGSQMVIGTTFRWYSAENNYAEPSKYLTVTFGTGSFDTPIIQPTFAPASVPDGNPGWQRLASIPLPRYYSADLVHGLREWRRFPQRDPIGWQSIDGILVARAMASGDLWAIDTAAPSIADGDLTYTVDPGIDQRFGLLLRVTEHGGASIYYDHGVFGLSTASMSIPLFTLPLAPESWHTIEVTFIGNSLMVAVDGVRQLQTIVTAPDWPSGAGFIGIRTWYYSTARFGSLTIGYP